MEVAEPIAKATVAIATIAKTGRRRSERTVNRRSKSTVSMRPRAGVERLDIGAVRIVGSDVGHLTRASLLAVPTCPDPVLQCILLTPFLSWRCTACSPARPLRAPTPD